jgi:hypothetical protein
LTFSGKTNTFFLEEFKRERERVERERERVRKTRLMVICWGYIIYPRVRIPPTHSLVAK